jgi:8-oxo-dGTP pyrophosphatase MutT (NUDIX family)
MTTPGYYESLPKKRMGSGALFFDDDGRFLIVKPTYKDGWEIPGGVVETNESPRRAVEREVEEEIGLKRKITKLLCVDYQDPLGEKTESLMFIFDGGILSNDDIGSIKPDTKEISEFRFVTENEALKLLIPVLARRVQQALSARDQDKGVYLENREQIS